MELEKKQVLLLPTNKDLYITTPANCENRPYTILKSTRINHLKLLIGSNGWFYGINDCYTPQHIYIVSNETITENDWWYNVNNKLFGNAKKCHNLINNEHHKKIIATTNPDLLNVPPISLSFVEFYIEQFNKGNIIEYINVEYNTNQKSIYDGWDQIDNIYTPEVLTLNLDNDGYIVTHYINTPHKWNKEEIINLFSDDPKSMREIYDTFCNIGHREGKTLLEKWFTQNT